MFHLILDFVTELGLVYLLTALFVVLDLLLLAARARRHRSEHTDRDRREARRDAEAQEERKAFEKRQFNFRPAP